MLKLSRKARYSLPGRDICNRNGEQQHLAVRQPAKPLTSQLLLCPVPLSWRHTPPEPSNSFERKRQIALSGRVWKSQEKRQCYLRPAFREGPAVSS